LILFLY